MRASGTSPPPFSFWEFSPPIAQSQAHNCPPQGGGFPFSAVNKSFAPLFLLGFFRFSISRSLYFFPVSPRPSVLLVLFLIWSSALFLTPFFLGLSSVYFSLSPSLTVPFLAVPIAIPGVHHFSFRPLTFGRFFPGRNLRACAPEHLYTRTILWFYICCSDVYQMLRLESRFFF